MNLKLLRRFIKSKDISADINLHHQNLVIDGEYLTSLYKKSLSQYILGGEYDRYANYLRTTLNCFIESQLTCYVIFKGAMDATNEKRLAIHQKIIDKTDAVSPGKDNEYCEPIFVKDVIKEVLDELGIRYFVCSGDVKPSLFSVAKHFDCPILTPFYDYAIFRVSCIAPDSIIFKKAKKMITCTIYKWESVKSLFPTSYHSLAILISIYSMDNSYHEKIPGIIGCQEFRIVSAAAGWIRKKDQDYAVKLLTDKLDEEEKSALLKNISEIRSLFYHNSGKFAIDYFTTKNTCQKNQFRYNIAIGKIAVPYINLKSKGTFSGSWLIVDKNKPDAVLSALDIVFYAYAYLTGKTNLTITFIGRQHLTSNIWEIHESIEQVSYKQKRAGKLIDFQLFLNVIMPKFNINALSGLPENSWLIMITLLYYNMKNNTDFTNGVHAVLLSYVILSVVSDKIGIIKRNNNSLVNSSPNNDRDERGVSYADCLLVGSKVVDLFYINEKSLRSNYSRSILHSMAEFQHCLQHMNYLNDLCGEFTRTCYHKSINMTFAYNILTNMNATDSPVDYVKTLIDCAPVFSIYKNMFDVFQECQKAIEG